MEGSPAPVLAAGSHDPLPRPLTLPGSTSHGARGAKTGRTVPASASPAPLHLLHPAAVNEAERPPNVATEATLAAVDFVAQVDASLRFCYVSAGSIEFLGYHRDYLSSLTLHELVPSHEIDELDALVARAQQSGKLETATLHLLKSLTTPILRRTADPRNAHARSSRVRARRVRGFALARPRKRPAARAASRFADRPREPHSAEKRDRHRPGRSRSHAHACGVAAGRYRRLPAHQPRTRLRRRRRHAARNRAPHPARSTRRRACGARGQRRIRRAVPDRHDDRGGRSGRGRRRGDC